LVTKTQETKQNQHNALLSTSFSILHEIVLYCIVLYCIVLYCIVLYSNITGHNEAYIIAQI